MNITIKVLKCVKSKLGRKYYFLTKLYVGEGLRS